MRLLADTNIVAAAIHALRGDGHDVVYIAERREDPGDEAILAEAVQTSRVLVTKDHDTGELVFREGARHAGVLLLDDLGDPKAETVLIRSTISSFERILTDGGFVRAGRAGARVASS